MRDCEDCAYHKEYINRKKMQELKTDKVITFFTCENDKMPHRIEDTKIANQCEYFSPDAWLK